MSHPLLKISLRRRHGKTVKNGAASHKTNYIDIFSEILNIQGHLNRCIGSKVMAILLNRWILPTGRVASGKVCPAACAAGLLYSTVRCFSRAPERWEQWEHVPSQFDILAATFG